MRPGKPFHRAYDKLPYYLLRSSLVKKDPRLVGILDRASAEYGHQSLSGILNIGTLITFYLQKRAHETR